MGNISCEFANGNKVFLYIFFADLSFLRIPMAIEKLAHHKITTWHSIS